MKYLLIIALLSFQVNAVEQDKLKHFAASAVISSVTQHYSQNWKLSAAVCMSVGLAKELTDNTIDNKDLLADAIGCATGLIAYKSAIYGFSILPDGAIIEVSYKF